MAPGPRESTIGGPERAPPGLWRITAAGLCAALVGIGIGRFAYTPLIPVLIEARWFAPADVVYLGAANLAGYLAGALAARPASARIAPGWLLRGSMLTATLACLACAAPVSLAWYFLWRFAAGLSGGIIMVLAAATILPHAPARRRGLVGGLIFTGVGLGVAASGTLVPLLLRAGLVETWIALAVLSGLLTLAAWPNWPPAPRPEAAMAHGGDRRTRGVAPRSLPVRALVLAYGLNAVALVPHMVFLVDFVARGLGRGVDAGARYWILYGLGATVGPLVAGHLADRTGFGPALRLAYLAQAAVVMLPALSDGPAALAVSSVLVGAFTPGIVPLALGRLHELLAHDPEAQRAAWSRATTSFALFQAASAYGYSYLFAHTAGSHAGLFEIGAAFVLAALLLDLAVGRLAPGRPAPASDRSGLGTR
ncbi:YbfB/YjiJ family MFS transporter [Methylobacterium nigriterrae]|uniref:YbfB/YjiJ family MFS transporter n=1 Tax=Methylobacterium nigriterrae TaxID=3127512 RepID=UPI0030132E1A